jgi:hypothetical protein
MVLDDEDIKKNRRDEQSGLSPARREAAEKKRQMKIFVESARKLRKTRDARAFAVLLRRVEFQEGSEQWKAAWDYFYERY